MDQRRVLSAKPHPESRLNKLLLFLIPLSFGMIYEAANTRPPCVNRRGRKCRTQLVSVLSSPAQPLWVCLVVFTCFLISFDFKIVQLKKRFQRTDEVVIIGLMPAHFLYGDKTDFILDPDRTCECRSDTWVELPGRLSAIVVVPTRNNKKRTRACCGCPGPVS